MFDRRIGVEFGTGSDRHPVSFAGCNLLIDHGQEVVSLWHVAQPVHLTAQLGFRLKELDVVPTSGSDPSCLQPRWSTAYDHDSLSSFSGILCGFGRSQSFPANCGVDGARNWQPLLQVARTPLIAADTGAYFVRASFVCLMNYSRVGDMGSRHTDEIDRTDAEQLLGLAD